MRHHAGVLQTVTVLGSHESIQQVHWFAHIVGHYDVLREVELRVFLRRPNASPVLAGCSEAPSTPGRSDPGPSATSVGASLAAPGPQGAHLEGGWDFENFDELSEAVSRLLHDLHQQGVSDSQIMIDFTGGQKVTSVVATAVTFNRPIKAQYVQTNFPHHVISYDIVLGLPETGGVGA
jgi:hypothetical protein